MEETQIPQNRDDTRNPDGTFKPGVSGNPGGRPRNTLKSYLQRKFNDMTDEQKEEWLKANKVAGVDQWKMAEGNPHQTNESDLKGNVIVVFDNAFIPTPKENSSE